MTQSSIRIAIVGVGNCASSLVQGLTYYKNVKGDAPVVGLKHNSIGGYSIKNIEVVAAFDVNKTKVGKDVAEAIFDEPPHPAVGQFVERPRFEAEGHQHQTGDEGDDERASGHAPPA